MALVIILVNLIILSSAVFPQERNIFDRLNSSKNHLVSGISESFEWYDIPVFAAYTARHYMQVDESKKLRLRAYYFEHEIQEGVGMNGRESFGSLDKDRIPYAILASRAVFTVGADIFTDIDISKNDYKHTFLFYKSLVYTHTLTELAKNWTYKERPDGSDGRSFFSGHSSTTFTAAAFLYREADDFIDGWEPVSDNKFLRTAAKTGAFTALYGWAGYVAFSRMRDNKHYFTDVAIGAAVGTLIGNFVYSGYFNNKEKNYDISLGIVNNVPNLSFYYKL